MFDTVFFEIPLNYHVTKQMHHEILKINVNITTTFSIHILSRNVTCSAVHTVLQSLLFSSRFEITFNVINDIQNV